MRRPPHSCAPSCCGSLLLPRIVAHEHRCIPRLCTDLCLDLPAECACSPLCIKEICPACQPAVCMPCGQPDACGRVNLHLRLPLSIRLCDGCGKSFFASADVETTVLLPGSFAACTQQVHMEPHICLLCAEPACTPGCFHVQLQVTLEIYLLRLEPFAVRQPKCACPQLPLYPPPMR